MADILAAEWLKLRTARSTRLVAGTVAVLTALMLALAWSFVATWDGLPPERRANAALGSLPALMGWVLSLVMAVFGTLAITGECASGMLQTTFLAMPSRARVMAAKAVLVGAASFALTMASLLATLVGSAAIIGSRPIGGQTALDAGGVAFLLAMGASAAMFALVGLGVGALTRSGIATVVVLALAWYVAPLVAGHIPAPWGPILSSLVPGALAGQIAGTGNVNSVFSGLLSPAQAAAVMVAYALVPPIAGGLALARRDA